MDRLAEPSEFKGAALFMLSKASNPHDKQQYCGRWRPYGLVDGDGPCPQAISMAALYGTARRY